MKTKWLLALITAVMLTAFVVKPIYAVTVIETNSTEQSTYISQPQIKYDSSYYMYTKLIRTWSKDGISTEFEDMNYPDFYGGMLMRAEGGLIIGVVELNEQIEKYFSDIIDTTDVIFVEVPHSYNELVREKDRIVDLMWNPQTDAEKCISSVGFPANRMCCIWLCLDCDSMSQAEEYAKSITDFDVVLELGKGIIIEDPMECIDVCCER